MRRPPRISSSTENCCESQARKILRADRPAARPFRTGAAWSHRRLHRRREGLQPGGPRRGRRALRRLRRPRRDGHGSPGGPPRQLRHHTRGGRRAGIRPSIQLSRFPSLPAFRPRDRGPLMARIEDYGLIGDLQTAALVGRDGSIDWACFPRFDSGACFAALLGTPEHGRWIVAPRMDAWEGPRRYRARTLVLETEWETDTGAVRVVDFMPPRGKAPDIVRIVEGLRGHVDMFSELIIRFDYGGTIPWLRRIADGRIAVAGPDALCFRTPIEHRGENLRTIGEFTVRQDERIPFTLTWYPSNERPPRPIDAEHALNETDEYWQVWPSRCRYAGKWKEEVQAPLAILKGLTYAPTVGSRPGAAPSLAPKIGGGRSAGSPD